MAGDVPSVPNTEQPDLLHSEKWATLAKPYAIWILFLVSVVIILPFIALFLLGLKDVDPKTRADRILDWAKFTLPTIVSFGSAVVGYFFGMRNNGGSSSPQPPPARHPGQESKLPLSAEVRVERAP